MWESLFVHHITAIVHSKGLQPSHHNDRNNVAITTITTIPTIAAITTIVVKQPLQPSQLSQSLQQPLPWYQCSHCSNHMPQLLQQLHSNHNHCKDVAHITAIVHFAKSCAKIDIKQKINCMKECEIKVLG